MKVIEECENYGVSKYLRSKDVRDMFNISDSTLQNWRIKGIIPAYKMGTTWVYNKDEVIEALMANRLN
ncbi:helix-turn-helix domain-containing protein [Draconibacterium mangrovi]|uniref:helix-turn-helix domain-containing protein n=1 Tax=Draconibacterium mangrovi TaxID=2697469 RepID=UPI0013CF4E78|nr:helix-turn-helix domain-containing protein [Draconibacterium mangrovi]